MNDLSYGHSGSFIKFSFMSSLNKISEQNHRTNCVTTMQSKQSIIVRLNSIDFDNRIKSNTEFFWTSGTKKVELNLSILFNNRTNSWLNPNHTADMCSEYKAINFKDFQNGKLFYSSFYLVTNEYQTTTVTSPPGFILFICLNHRRVLFFCVNSERKAIEKINK